MKNSILAAGLLFICCSFARAAPYFRLAGRGNWNLADGVSFSAKDLAKTQNVTVLALVTHSTADGSILPRAWVDAGFADAWTPLAVGFGFGGGSTCGKLGASANVSPIARAFAIKTLDAVNKPMADSLKGLFEAMPDNLTFAFGPSLNAQVVQDGRFMPMNRWWDDPLRFDFLAQWHFGKLAQKKIIEDYRP